MFPNSKFFEYVYDSVLIRVYLFSSVIKKVLRNSLSIQERAVLLCPFP
jgi:hypothetical protein